MAGAYDDAVVPGSCFAVVARRVVGRAVVVALVAPLVLTGCSRDGGGDADGARRAGEGGDRDGGGAAAPAFGVTVVSADVQAMAPRPAAFPDDVKAAVDATLDAYLEHALVGPLRSGKPPTAALATLFTDAALGRLAAPGPDRAAVLEQGAPLAGKVTQDRANAALTALTAPGGDVVLVTARLDVAHTVRTGDGPIAVVRSGELVLVPFGGWRIDAYDMRTARDTQPTGKR